MLPQPWKIYKFYSWKNGSGGIWRWCEMAVACWGTDSCSFFLCACRQHINIIIWCCSGCKIGHTAISLVLVGVECNSLHKVTTLLVVVLQSMWLCSHLLWISLTIIAAAYKLRVQLSDGPQVPSWGGSFEPSEPPLRTGLLSNQHLLETSNRLRANNTWLLLDHSCNKCYHLIGWRQVSKWVCPLQGSDIP